MRCGLQGERSQFSSTSSCRSHVAKRLQCDAWCRYAAADVLRASSGNVLEMLQGGYSPAELRSCGVAVAAMRACGCSAEQLKSAGFSLRELKIGGCTALALKEAGCAHSMQIRRRSSCNAPLQVYLLRAG